MKNQLILALAIALTLGCEEKSNEKTQDKAADEKPLLKFIPAGYRLYKEAQGDLNGDGVDDQVLIIRGTNSENIQDGYDENPHGVMIFFGDGGNYKLALEKRDNLPFVRDDGCLQVMGGSCATKLDVWIKNGNLYIETVFRSSGDWWSSDKSTYRYKNSEFELIGSDSYYENEAEESTTTISINYPAKKKCEKNNSNKEVCSKITVEKPLLLRNE